MIYIVLKFNLILIIFKFEGVFTSSEETIIKGALNLLRLHVNEDKRYGPFSILKIGFQFSKAIISSASQIIIQPEAVHAA